MEKKIIEPAAPQTPQVTAKCWWKCPSPIPSRSLPSLIHGAGVLPASRKSVNAFSLSQLHTHPAECAAEARMERKARGKWRYQSLLPQEVGWAVPAAQPWLCPLSSPPHLINSILQAHDHLLSSGDTEAAKGTCRTRCPTCECPMCVFHI